MSTQDEECSNNAEVQVDGKIVTIKFNCLSEELAKDLAKAIHSQLMDGHVTIHRTAMPRTSNLRH